MESMDPKISDSINKEKNNGESKQKRNDKQSRGNIGKEYKELPYLFFYLTSGHHCDIIKTVKEDK